MKKITLSLLCALIGAFAHATNGLKGIIVEKYYVTDANDSTVSANAAGGVLPAGSITWRIYVDMLSGYKFKTAYGSSTHTLFINSTAPFFNDENYGDATPNGITANHMKQGLCNKVSISFRLLLL